MSKKVRLLALFLALTLSAAMFAGCGPKEAEKDNSSVSSSTTGDVTSDSSEDTSSGDDISSGTESTETSSTASGAASSGGSTSSKGSGGTSSSGFTSGKGDKGNEGVTVERKLEGNVYTSGFPIVKKQVTLRVMVEETTMHNKFSTLAFSTDYAKKTNVNIKWETYTSADRNTKKTATLRAGNYPDVMCMIDAFRSSEIMQYGTNGALLDLTSDLKKWAPNVQKALDTNAMAKKAVTAPNGKVYSVPSISSLDDHMVFPSKIYINKKWLDTLGLKAPTTYAEFINVMRKFKNNDPNGNGIKDEIPFVVNNFNPMFAGAPQGIEWRWDADRVYVDNNGKIGYFMGSEAYKDSIQNFFRPLYAENLLDRKTFENGSSVATVTKKGNVGCFVELAASIALKDSNINDYVPLDPIKSTASSKQTVMTNRRGKVMPFAFVVTATASKDQKKQIALRWVDYFFTTDGYIYEQFGPKSAGYYKTNKDGTIENAKDPSTGKPKSDADRYKVAPGYVIPSWYTEACEKRWRKKSDSEMTVNEKYFKKYDSDYVISTYSKLMNKNYIGHLFFSDKDQTKLNSLENNLHSYAYNTGMAFVKGDQNIDTGWNDYMKELEKKGLKDLINLYQTAYDKQK